MAVELIAKRAAQRERRRQRDRIGLRQHMDQHEARRHHRQHGEDHLRAAQPEHDAAHAAQARQRKLQADREHQEHHAELGEVAGLLAVGHQAERVRSDQDADHQVAQHRRQVEQAEQHHAGHGGRQQHEGQFERHAVILF
jgi:hypothetical protein